MKQKIVNTIVGALVIIPIAAIAYKVMFEVITWLEVILLDSVDVNFLAAVLMVAALTIYLIYIIRLMLIIFEDIGEGIINRIKR